MRRPPRSPRGLTPFGLGLPPGRAGGVRAGLLPFASRRGGGSGAGAAAGAVLVHGAGRRARGRRYGAGGRAAGGWGRSPGSWPDGGVGAAQSRPPSWRHVSHGFARAREGTGRCAATATLRRRVGERERPPGAAGPAPRGRRSGLGRARGPARPPQARPGLRRRLESGEKGSSRPRGAARSASAPPPMPVMATSRPPP